MALANIVMRPDGVAFDAEGGSHLYVVTTGRLYLGGLGTPVHQSRDGSVDFGTIDDLRGARLYAGLLGAKIVKA